MKRLYRILIIIFLILNLILMARLLGIIYLPGEITSLEKARQGAESVIKYSEDLARSYNVDEQKEVREVLARFKYEVEKTGSSDEMASIMIDYGRQVQNIIFREVQNQRISKVLNIVNSQGLSQEGIITISSVNDEIKLADPHSILNDETREKLSEIPLNQTLELKIEGGRAQLSTEAGFFNQVDYLQAKVASLERQLNSLKKEAGYETMSGKGIRIRIYDRETDLEREGIVHDSDIRDIVNELLIAGAEGVEVGGERLIATSSIRCVGPTVLVNNKPIAVNPVVIKAIGEPEVLKSSLDIVKNTLAGFGIEVEIQIEEEIVLNKV